MFKKFISYYKPYKGVFFCDMLASFFMALISLVYPELSRQIYKNLVPNNNWQLVLILGGILLVLYIIRMFLKFYVQYYGHMMGTKMQADMRRELFAHLEKLSYTFYDEHETGRIMSRMTTDLQDVSELAHHGPENIFICGFTVVGSLVYLGFINIYLTLVISLCIPLLVVISLTMRKRMRKAFSESKRQIAVINGSIESSISGIRVTKAFTNSDKEMEKFEVSNQDYVKARAHQYKAMGQFGSSTNFILDLFNVVCIVGGGIIAILGNAGVITNIPFDIDDYLAFVVSIAVFINPLNTLINFVEQYQDGVAGFTRFLEILELKPETDKNDALKNLKLKGNIEFKNVTFKYESSKCDVLKNMSFKIKEGSTTALVGESGGGKTTICHLLPRFYELEQGNILIDGINVKDINLETLRRNIGIVQQDVYLFNGSIKDNILYGKLDASEEELILASKRANIYDFIMSLPDKFDTQIGERGVKLSGGQKQRLSIARVFLKNPSILILDEATSALDNTTEIMIQQALFDLSKGRTTIVVAHRLSTIKNATNILVVEHGKIVEEGTHNELLAKNGEYATLYNLQFANILR